MKSIGIFYFSGTGNTAVVAAMIRDEFLRYGYEVDLMKVESVQKDHMNVDIQKYDLIGIGSPVIGFGVPRLVTAFARSLPKGNGRKVFIFRTAGGVAPINYNASKPLIRKMNRKGYEVFHERVFSIASNWIKKFDDGVVKQLYEATKKKTGIMCQELMKGERRILKTGMGLKIRMEMAAFLFPKVFPLIGKDLRVSESCSHCSICVKNCPSGNIYEKNGRIKFKMSCNCCMRCVYNCPCNAVSLKKFSIFSLQGGYDIQKTLSKPYTGSEEKNGAVPPFFQGYVQDDAL